MKPKPDTQTDWRKDDMLANKTIETKIDKDKREGERKEIEF